MGIFGGFPHPDSLLVQRPEDVGPRHSVLPGVGPATLVLKGVGEALGLAAWGWQRQAWRA